MKWFKHMSNAATDDKLVILREQLGMWGVGAYWTLLELVAAQLKPTDKKAVAVIRESDLCSLFGCKRDKLRTFSECLRNVFTIAWNHSGNIITIEIPKLLEIRDNYSRDSEETSKPTKKPLEAYIQSKSKIKDKEQLTRLNSSDQTLVKKAEKPLEQAIPRNADELIAKIAAKTAFNQKFVCQHCNQVHSPQYICNKKIQADNTS